MDPSLSNDHKIFAVVGGDLTISSLGASMAKKMGKHCVFKEELRCFLMDTRGYIVYHPDFEDAYNDTSKVKILLRENATPEVTASLNSADFFFNFPSPVPVPGFSPSPLHLGTGTQGVSLFPPGFQSLS